MKIVNREEIARRTYGWYKIHNKRRFEAVAMAL